MFVCTYNTCSINNKRWSGAARVPSRGTHFNSFMHVVELAGIPLSSDIPSGATASNTRPLKTTLHSNGGD